jgi:hypothetical protein
MESNNPTLYPLFPRVFGAELALYVFFSPPLLTLWIFAAYYYYMSGAVSVPIVKVAAYYTAVFVFAVLFYGNTRAIRQARGVVLDGGRIVKKGAWGGAALECADVTGVSCTKNPLFNRRMVLQLAKGGFSLPLNVRDGHKMVEAVFENLAALGRPSGVDEKKTADVKRRLYAVALRYNALYRLRGAHIRNFVKFAAAAAAFNGFVAAAYWEQGLVIALMWALAGMMFQTLAYLAAEKVWALGINKNGGADAIDAMVGGFQTTHAMSALAALLAGMVLGIAVTVPAP